MDAVAAAQLRAAQLRASQQLLHTQAFSQALMDAAAAAQLRAACVLCRFETSGGTACLEALAMLP